MKDVELLRSLTEERNALNGRCTGSDDRHSLVLEPVEISERTPSGVFIIPPAGVEGVALEIFDARNAGQLGTVERAVRHGDEARA